MSPTGGPQPAGVTTSAIPRLPLVGFYGQAHLPSWSLARAPGARLGAVWWAAGSPPGPPGAGPSREGLRAVQSRLSGKASKGGTLVHPLAGSPAGCLQPQIGVVVGESGGQHRPSPPEPRPDRRPYCRRQLKGKAQASAQGEVGRAGRGLRRAQPQRAASRVASARLVRGPGTAHGPLDASGGSRLRLFDALGR